MTDLQKIYVKNTSNKINDNVLNAIIGAIKMIIPAFCDSWSIDYPDILAADNSTKFGDKDWIFMLVDNDPEGVGEGALAYHSESFSDNIYGYILITEILKNGGCVINYHDNIISDKNSDKIYSLQEQSNFPQVNSVASALCHEIMETLCDRTCNIMWTSNRIDRQRRNIIFCAEVCDMVENNNIYVHKDGLDIALSDYVLPAWKDQFDRKGPYNYRQTLKEPFMLDKGGYAVIYASDGQTTIFGERKLPPWKLRGRRLKMLGCHQKKEKCLLM